MQNLSVTSPWLMLVFPVTAGFLTVFFILGRDRSKRAWIRFFLRMTVLALLALALAGFSATVTRRGRVAVFAVDRSSSHAAFSDDAFRQIHEIEKKLSTIDRLAKIEFAKDVSTFSNLLPPSVKFGTRRNIRIDPAGTDIASAIDLAVKAADGAQNAAIVVFTDGKANRGDAFAACIRAKASGCRVHFRAPEAPPVNDVFIELLAAPQSAKVGEPFNCRFRMSSTSETAVTLRLFRGEELVLVRQVLLGTGTPSVIVTGTEIIRPGFTTFRAVVDAAPEIDADTETSKTTFTVTSEDKGKVLLISTHGDTAAGKWLKDIPGIELSVEKKNNQPNPLDDFQVIVLEDIPAERIGQERLIELEQAVKKGAGLVVFGGPNSFAAGAYAGTPLEKLLPVWPHPKERKPVSVVVCLDASGSMSEKLTPTETKFHSAASGLFRLIGAMADRDTISVLTFNRTATERIEPDSVAGIRKKEGELRKAFGKIHPSGGTNIYTALEAARKIASATSPGQPHHIILFSDGKSEPGEFDKDAFISDNISITTIATGTNPDQSRLQDLAKLTRGRSYTINDAARLGEVFLRDLGELSGSGIKENSSIVTAVQPVPGVPENESFPRISRMNRTTLKRNATLLAKSEDGLPVIASWRYGLGQVYAAPFAPGNWMMSSVSSITSFGGKLVPGLVRAASGGETETCCLKAGTADDEVVMEFSVKEPGDLFGKYEAGVIAPDGSEFSVPLRITFPGSFRGSFPAGAGGTYGIIIMNSSGSVLARGAVVITRPTESRFFTGSDYNMLRKLAKAGGGKLFLSAPTLDELEAGTIRERIPLFGYFLVIAILLYLLDLLFDALRGLRRIRSNP